MSEMFEDAQRFITDSTTEPLAPEQFITKLKGRTITMLRKLEAHGILGAQLVLDNGESYALVGNALFGSELKVVAPNQVTGSNPIWSVNLYDVGPLSYVELRDEDEDVNLTLATTIALNGEPSLYMQRVIPIDGGGLDVTT